MKMKLRKVLGGGLETAKSCRDLSSDRDVGPCRPQEQGVDRGCLEVPRIYAFDCWKCTISGNIPKEFPGLLGMISDGRILAQQSLGCGFGDCEGSEES